MTPEQELQQAADTFARFREARAKDLMDFATSTEAGKYWDSIRANKPQPSFDVLSVTKTNNSLFICYGNSDTYVDFEIFDDEHTIFSLYENKEMILAQEGNTIDMYKTAKEYFDSHAPCPATSEAVEFAEFAEWIKKNNLPGNDTKIGLFWNSEAAEYQWRTNEGEFINSEQLYQLFKSQPSKTNENG